MKQMKSSDAETIDVIGLPESLRIFTAFLIVLTSSWIVVTKVRIYEIMKYVHMLTKL